MLKFITVFYFFMGVLGMLLVIWRHNTAISFNPMGMPGADWPLYLAGTFVLLVFFHLFARLGDKYSVTLKRCSADIRRFLGHLNRGALIFAGVVSGVGEEIFFRGWLQNELGLFITSLIFALVHIPPARHWRFWRIFVFFAGLVLGLLCIVTDTLLYAILLHVGINAWNLNYIIHDAPHEPEDE